MGALPKKKISTYRRGKRRASIKKKMVKKVQSLKSIAQHALNKSHHPDNHNSK